MGGTRQTGTGRPVVATFSLLPGLFGTAGTSPLPAAHPSSLPFLCTRVSIPFLPNSHPSELAAPSLVGTFCVPGVFGSTDSALLRHDLTAFFFPFPHHASSSHTPHPSHALFLFSLHSNLYLHVLALPHALCHGTLAFGRTFVAPAVLPALPWCNLLSACFASFCCLLPACDIS